MSISNWTTAGDTQPPRSVAMLTVIVLHVLLAWLIVNGTATQLIERVVVPATLLLTDRAAPIPPTPKSVLSKPLPEVRPAAKSIVPLRSVPDVPSVVSSAPIAVAAVVPTAVSSEPVLTAKVVAPSVAAVPAAAESSPAPVRTVASIRPGTCPKPPYPALSRRLEEVGTVTLRFLVGADGKVLQSQIEQSSGFVRLDEAARNGLGHCTFQPASVDGKPEQAWATIRYAWRLE